MSEIDSLEIGIKAQATTAINALDRLITRVDSLSTTLSQLNTNGLNNLANGVSRLGVSMQFMNNVSKQDFTRLANGINKLGNINASGLTQVANSMQQISSALNGTTFNTDASNALKNIASSMTSFGYKTMDNAITNLPLLANGLRDLMAILSTAPQVSQNLIDMTNALSNLASNGQQVGTVSRSLTRNINRYGNSAENARNKTKGFASAIGKFYATYFMVVRGTKKLWEAVKSSMDYIEVLNYFNSAFGQVANTADLGSWEKLGYKSADEYYNSFADRAKQLTSKMTGFTVNADNTLTATGQASLGINPSSLMNYQAMFAQMSSSMGVTSETSTLLSQALTEIGADLASVKNMDFEDVWHDMASGLAGMSRTLDKYGVNIRNVNLQQKLTELGINANITALNQNDKALLRTIILLDTTRYAWGDLSTTLNQPTNQTRLLSANFQNLARSIGNLFVPMISKALPYINGLVIALQRLIVWIGSLFKIDLSKITQSVGNSGISDITGDIEGMGDALDDATASAKEYKNQLMGFDEINKLSDNTNKSAGGSGAGGGISSGLLDEAFLNSFSEYQASWDRAFAEIENKANNIADKLQAIVNSDAFKVIAASLGVFLVKLAVFKIGGWAYNAFYFIASNWQNLLKSPKVNLTIQLVGFAAALGSLKNLSDQVAEMGTYDEILDASKETFGGFFGTLYANTIATFGGEDSIFNNFSGWVEQLGNPELWDDVADNWTTGMDVITSDVKNWWNDDIKPWFTKDKWAELGEGMVQGIKDKWQALKDWWNRTTLVRWYNDDVKPWFTKAKWDETYDNIKVSLKNKWNDVQSWWNGTAIARWISNIKQQFGKNNTDSWFSNIGDSIKQSWDNAIEAMKQVWNNFANWLNGKLNFSWQGVVIAGREIVPPGNLNLGHIPTFATGGFPEDGWFRANHGEMIGQFDNGQSVVANNQQITQGIANAVYGAISQALSEHQNSTIVKVVGDPKGMFNVVVDEMNNYIDSTGVVPINI